MENNYRFNCETCNYHTNDWSNYDKHTLTKKHASFNLTNVEFIYICEPCKYKTNDCSDFEQHKRSKKHKKVNCYHIPIG